MSPEEKLSLLDSGERLLLDDSISDQVRLDRLESFAEMSDGIIYCMAERLFPLLRSHCESIVLEVVEILSRVIVGRIDIVQEFSKTLEDSESKYVKRSVQKALQLLVSLAPPGH